MKLTPEQYAALLAKRKKTLQVYAENNAQYFRNSVVTENHEQAAENMLNATHTPKPRKSNPGASVTLKFDWPPSVNTYWRHPSKGKLAGRHLISEKGREYRKHVIKVCSGSGLNPWIGHGKLAVRLDCYPPDRRRRDLDNLPKSILDALQHAGLIVDDSDIDELHIVRHEMGGYVMVTITEI